VRKTCFLGTSGMFGSFPALFRVQGEIFSPVRCDYVLDRKRGTVGCGVEDQPDPFPGHRRHVLLLSVLFPALTDVRSPPEMYATSNSMERIVYVESRGLSDIAKAQSALLLFDGTCPHHARGRQP